MSTLSRALRYLLLPTLLAVSGMTAVVATGCDNNAEEQPAAEATHPHGGTHHDPAIAKSEVPEGAWYCDMGSVHYHQTEKGDGTCPICKMKLKQKGAE